MGNLAGALPAYVSVTQMESRQRAVSNRPSGLKSPCVPGDSKKKINAWLIPFVLLGAAIFLYSQVFILPATPRAATGDQSIYLHSAARMYDGEIIYRDYDQITFPGADVLYLTLFKWFGVRAWIPQAMLVLVGVISVWLSLLIAVNVMEGPAVLLPGFLFLALPYSSYLDATHHLYSVLAAISALAVVMEERTVLRLAWAGLLFGLGTFFTQSLALGPAAFGLFVAWESFRKRETGRTFLKKEISLFAAYIACVSVLSAYIIWKIGLKRFLYYTVVLNAKYFSTYEIGTWKTYMLGWPSAHNAANWPDLTAWPLIHLVVPLIYILFFVRYWRERRRRPQEPWEKLMLINVTGLCLFLSIASAPAWNRLYTISLPALIMVVWFLNVPSKLERMLQGALWVLVVILAFVKPIVTQTRWKAVLDLPTGRTAFFEPGLYQETKWVLERAYPSSYFFGDQLLCFALRLKNPSRVAYVTPYAFTRPEEVQSVVHGLEAHSVPFVSWYPGLDAAVKPSGNNLSPLREYLESRYHIAAHFFNGHTIWERNRRN